MEKNVLPIIARPYSWVSYGSPTSQICMPSIPLPLACGSAFSWHALPRVTFAKAAQSMWGSRSPVAHLLLRKR